VSTFEAEWARCGPWLQAALDHAGNTHELTDVEIMVRDGDARFWAGRQAAMVTVIETAPRQRRLLIWLAGGSLSELVEDLRPAAEAWARRRGCQCALIVGRPGWERALALQGYAPLARLIAKDL
jgi:hypothetical protein